MADILLGFVIPLAAIALAELGDKTQLCILFLSSKTKRHSHLLAGVMLAFLIVDGTAILLGSWITSVVPAVYLKAASGALFIAFGALMFFGKGICNPEKMKSQNPFIAGFMMIFISEWGDKTQIASGLLATQYDGLAVLAGTMAALFALSVMAIYAGKLIIKKIHPNTVSKVAGAAFVIIGLSFFFI